MGIMAATIGFAQQRRERANRKHARRANPRRAASAPR
jgi:hypothetical protein